EATADDPQAQVEEAQQGTPEGRLRDGPPLRLHRQRAGRGDARSWSMDAHGLLPRRHRHERGGEVGCTPEPNGTRLDPSGLAGEPTATVRGTSPYPLARIMKG